VVNFIALYSTISVLLIIPLIRAVVISRDYGRYPRIIELLLGGYYSTDTSRRSVRIVIRFALALAVFLLWGWHAGSLEMDIQRGGMKIFWGMTAYNLGSISYVLRSVYFNVFLRTASMSAKQENSAFFKEIGFIPGFGDTARTLITLVTLMAMFSSFLMMLTGR